MSLFDKPSLAELVAQERDRLDAIFGNSAYQIESTDAGGATVRNAQLEWNIAWEPDGSITTYLTAGRGQPWEEEAILDIWVAFLGDDIALAPLPAGKAKLSVAEQIRRELVRVDRLALAVFSDPTKARDAAHFVQGYQRAYGDYCCGSWDADPT